jgi:cytochrome c-type biogenesis protein CcmF
MIAETGLAALWLAAGLAGLQFVLMILGLRERAEVGRGMRSIAVVQGALTLIAFATLLIVFARSDMSVALVFENSHSAKPFIYKVAGAWGNHEGSMLMWVTILAVAGAFVALFAHRTTERTLTAALGAQAVLALGFYTFLLIASTITKRSISSTMTRAASGPSSRSIRPTSVPPPAEPASGIMPGTTMRWSMR